MHNNNRGILENLKPSASRKGRLLLVTVMWVLAGTGLLCFGGYWLMSGFGMLSLAWIFLAIIVGLIKSHYVLDKVARRVVDRIIEQGDDRCIGGAFSWQSWMMIIAMILLGWVLRHSELQYEYLGILYVAVGSGLLRSDRIIYKALKSS